MPPNGKRENAGEADRHAAYSGRSCPIARYVRFIHRQQYRIPVRQMIKKVVQHREGVPAQYTADESVGAAPPSPQALLLAAR